MIVDLPNPDQSLLDRYFEAVLIRHTDGRYDLQTARLELSQAFALFARSQPAFREHIQAIIEAGDDA
jgi:hypothetical protein